MSFTPISGATIQYQKTDGTLASGYFLKLYNTSNVAINMYSTSTGTGALAKCALDSAGYPLNGSSAIFTPFTDQEYKIALYTNAVDADADTTGNADWFHGPLPQQALAGEAFELFETVALMVASTTLNIGDHLRTLGYYSIGDGGGNDYDVVAAATGTPDAGSFINLDTHQAKGLFTDDIYRIKQFGAYIDNTNATVTTAAFNNCYTFVGVSFDGRSDMTIGAGKFATNAKLSWGKRVGVFGSGAREDSQIIPTGTFDAVSLTVGEFARIGGFQIDGTALTGIGIDVDAGSHIHLVDIRIKSCSSHGIYWRAGNSGKLDKIDSVLNGGDGIRIQSFQGTNSATSSNTLTLIDFNALSNTGWGINLLLGDACNIVMGILQENLTGGMNIGGASGTQSIGNHATLYCERNGASPGDGPDLNMTAFSTRNHVTLLATTDADNTQDAGTNNYVLSLAGANTYAMHSIKPSPQITTNTGRTFATQGGTGKDGTGGSNTMLGGDGEGTDQNGGNAVIKGGAATGSGEAGQTQMQTTTGVSLIGNANDQTKFRGVIVTDQTAQAIEGAGAVDVTSQVTHITTTAGDAYTLANGSNGQRKTVVMLSGAGGTGTLTPTSLLGFTSIAFTSAGHTAELLFTNSAWTMTGGTATQS